MITIKITKNVPLPASPKKTSTGRTEYKYPFSSMRKGDSFFVPKTKITCVSSSASKFTKSSNKKLICRTEGDGVRCWCIGYSYKKRAKATLPTVPTA